MILKVYEATEEVAAAISKHLEQYGHGLTGDGKGLNRTRAISRHRLHLLWRQLAIFLVVHSATPNGQSIV